MTNIQPEINPEASLEVKQAKERSTRPASGWTDWAISAVSSKIAGAVIDPNDIPAEVSKSPPKSSTVQSQGPANLANQYQSTYNNELFNNYQTAGPHVASKPLVLSAKLNSDWGNEGWGDELVFLEHFIIVG